jgi:hypothetical protein
MKLRILFLGLGLMIGTNLIAQTATAPSAGDGSSETPYQITTLENLCWLSQNSSEWDKYFVQTALIDAAASSDWDGGNGWTAIGNSTTKFTGSYNGQSFTINGLFIDRGSDNYQSLFGFTEGATIQNLGVTNVDITGANYVAGLMAYASTASVVTNCYSTGSVKGAFYVGGLVGSNFNGSVSNSYSASNVYGTGSLGGGLIGLNQGGTVSNCYSRGNVSQINNTQQNSGNETPKRSLVSLFGGCIGSILSGTVNYCYATGLVSCNGLTNIGFTGGNNGTCLAIFFDSQTSGQSSDAVATAKTTAEMKTQTTFTDAAWDFAVVWEMIGENYPRLRTNPDLSLPVELSRFTADYFSGAVVLNWTTGSEFANLGYILERRNVGADWNKIADYSTHAALKGQGTTAKRTEYSFTDLTARSGQDYYYRLSDVSFAGEITTYPPIFIQLSALTELPPATRIERAYPNPFNPQTCIAYHLAETSPVEIIVFDLLGRMVKTLQNGGQAAGSYHVTWNGTDENQQNVPSGVYLIHLQTTTATHTQKVLFMK